MSSAMKTTRTTTLALLAAAFLVTGITVVTGADRPSATGPEITWKTRSEGFVKTEALTTYRAILDRRIDLERARDTLGMLLEATGEKADFDKLQEVDGRMIFTADHDPSAVFDIDPRTGTYLFNRGLKGYSDERETPGLPSDKEAPEVAREYLAKLQLLPMNERELEVRRVGGLAMAAADDGKSSEPYKKLVTVSFGRILDGLRVQGRGSRLVVHLGEESELFGVIANWHRAEPRKVDASEIKSDDVIALEIRRRLFRMADLAQSIEIQRAGLVLFDDGRGRIEPAIFVVAAARYEGPERSKDGVEIPVDFYVPVLKDSQAYYPFIQDAGARWPGGDAEKRSNQ